MLRLGIAATLAGAWAVLPATALQADAPPPPLPDAVKQGLGVLTALGFHDIVSVYHELRPTITLQPLLEPSFVGITEGWVTGVQRIATIKLRPDLQGSPAMLAAVLAHELLHVRQFADQPDVYANCLEREVPAYELEAAVLQAWCTANPSERYGLPISNYYLMSMAEHSPGSLESFVRKAGCGTQ
jgi:hypothetical protein